MADDIKIKQPEFISLKALDENDPEYPEVAIQDKARIPVIALDYEDKDIAKEKELLIDYKKGGIYVVDAEDRTIIHDLTKLIAENYLNQIDGGNTYINIEGLGIVNLSEIIKLLYDSRIAFNISIDEAIAVPKDAVLDNASITIAGNKVEVFGFHDALPLSTPRVSADGTRIEWTGGIDDEGNRPGDDTEILDEPPGGFEPPKGAKQNVLYIYPTDNTTIILYNKPQQYTPIKADSAEDSYDIKLPLSQDQYSVFHWRLDSEAEHAITWPTNIVWLKPKPEKAEANGVYIFECQTWDYGNTWIISYIHYIYTEDMFDQNVATGVYYTDENGAILTNPDSTLFVDGEATEELQKENPDEDTTYVESPVDVISDGTQSI